MLGGGGRGKGLGKSVRVEGEGQGGGAAQCYVLVQQPAECGPQHERTNQEGHPRPQAQSGLQL